MRTDNFGRPLVAQKRDYSICIAVIDNSPNGYIGAVKGGNCGFCFKDPGPETGWVDSNFKAGSYMTIHFPNLDDAMNWYNEFNNTSIE